MRPGHIYIYIYIYTYIYIANNHAAPSRSLYLVSTWIGLDCIVGKVTPYGLDGPGLNPGGGSNLVPLETS